MNSRALLYITKTNLKHNLLPHILIAILVAALTPVFFGISSLNQTMAAQPLEIMVSLTGLILLTPVFLPEQNEAIRDVIRARKVTYLKICIIRLLISVIIMLMINAAFVLIMKSADSDVTLMHFFAGTISGLFLGSLGFAAAGITDSVSAGYMLSLLYYMINFSGKKHLGIFFLFSYSGSSFTEKYYLLGFSIFLIVFTLVFKYFKKK
ncbi:MAG: hypothetical protein Q4F95_11750 [Oscillospiraceae bacterium]|nr:hypothetical protein [Oscillospiraceae bacterium]